MFQYGNGFNYNCGGYLPGAGYGGGVAMMAGRPRSSWSLVLVLFIVLVLLGQVLALY